MNTGGQHKNTFDLRFPIAFIFLSPHRVCPQLFEPTFLGRIVDVISDIMPPLTNTDLSLVGRWPLLDPFSALTALNFDAAL